MCIEDIDGNASETVRIVQQVRPMARIKRASNLLDAVVQALKAKIPFDLVLIDQKLNGAVGTEFVAPLRNCQSTADCPVVLLTANCSDTVRSLALANDISALVYKPLDPKRLDEIINQGRVFWELQDLPKDLGEYRQALAALSAMSTAYLKNA